MLPNRWTEAWENNDLDPLPMPLQPVLTGLTIGPLATDRGGKEGISMNGAGNIAGLIDSVLPASEVVAQIASEAEECIRGITGTPLGLKEDS